MRRDVLLGWVALVMNVLVALAWAGWGTLEAFHEGWFHASLWANLGSFVAYTGGMWFSVVLGLLWLRWRRLAAALYGAIWLGVGAFFASVLLAGAQPWWGLLFTLVFCGFGGLGGVAMAFGTPPRVSRVALTLPLLLSASLSAEPAWRIAHRFDDGNRGARVVGGLEWAPRGPGWPDGPVSWEDAKHRCAYLSPDGAHLLDVASNCWRLPSRAELVCSLTRGGRTAGGKLEGSTPSFQTLPDKESPLWDPNSEIIYYWTSEEADAQRAYFVAYNGAVFTHSKAGAMGTQGFRAVRVRDVPVGSSGPVSPRMK